MTTQHRPIRPLRLAALTLAAVMVMSACSDSSDATKIEPATVQEVGPDLWQIELTERAFERTGVELTEVAMTEIDGTERMVVPYSAVMYHFDGSTWTYTNPTPMCFLRAPIEIDYIEGDVAVLHDGPAVGTSVVSVGAAELYGVEFGIGK